MSRNRCFVNPPLEKNPFNIKELDTILYHNDIGNDTIGFGYKFLFYFLFTNLCDLKLEHSTSCKNNTKPFSCYACEAKEWFEDTENWGFLSSKNICSIFKISHTRLLSIVNLL